MIQNWFANINDWFFSSLWLFWINNLFLLKTCVVARCRSFYAYNLYLWLYIRCPACNHATAPDELMRNKHADRIVSIVQRQKEIASKAYFEKLIAGGASPSSNLSESQVNTYIYVVFWLFFFINKYLSSRNLDWDFDGKTVICIHILSSYSWIKLLINN
jgi:hypothetical protein